MKTKSDSPATAAPRASSNTDAGATATAGAAGNRPALTRFSLPAALLCGLGLVFAVKLAFLHFAVHHDPTTESFCAISEQVNCDTVAASHWSVFAEVPVAVWGVLGYLWLGALALWAARLRAAAVTVLFTLGALGACVVSVALAVISVVEIRSLCVLCVGTYLINLVLLALGTIEWRRLGGWLTWRQALRSAPRDRRPATLSVVALGLAALGAVAGFPKYWHDSVTTAGTTAAGETDPTGPRRGTTAEGHAWIGAEDPSVTIVEFSDYECPFCARAHARIRGVVRDYPDRIRLVHRHTPLDHACNPIVTRPFHRHACEYARIAICAGLQGRFWETNDWLYEHSHDRPPPDFAAVVHGSGLDIESLQMCMEHDADRLLAVDLKTGVERRITGTPTFQIGDRLYPGQIPEEVLADLLGRPNG